MEETKLEKLARLSGKATSKALDALGKRGFDIRGKLSAPISRVPRRNPFTEAKNERVMADPETIYNWRRLDDRITTSGQPTEPQLADIHDLGVRHIVNLGLHTHEKALPDEATSVSRLGMTYIHIPVDSTDIVATCWAWMRPRRVPIWKMFGIPRACGRPLSVARRYTS